MPRHKCCFLLSIFSKAYLVVTTCYINGREKARMYKFFQQIINSRQWVDILLCLPIQCMIINHHS